MQQIENFLRGSRKCRERDDAAAYVCLHRYMLSSFVYFIASSNANKMLLHIYFEKKISALQVELNLNAPKP